MCSDPPLRHAVSGGARAHCSFDYGQLVQNHFVLSLEKGNWIDGETRWPTFLRHHHSRVPCTEARTYEHSGLRTSRLLYRKGRQTHTGIDQSGL